MSTLAIALCFVAALAWGGLDVCRKLLGERGDPIAVSAWLAIFQAPLFGSWWIFQGHIHWSNYLGVGAGLIALNALALVLFVWAVRIAPLSLTIPYLSFTPVFVAWAAWVILDEQLSAIQWLGSALVVLGGLMLNAERGMGLPGLVLGVFRSRGALLMLSTAILWSIAMPLDKVALQFAHVSSHGFMQNFGAGVVLILALVMTSAGRSTLRGSIGPLWAILCGSAVVAMIAMTAQLYGLLEAPAGTFEALKRTIGLVILPLLGGHFFGEKVDARLLLGLLLIGSGASAVILGA